MIKNFAVALVIVGAFFSLSLSLMPATAHAQQDASVNARCNRRNRFLDLPPWYTYLEIDWVQKANGASGCEVVGPKTTSGDFDWPAAIPRILLAVVEIILRIGGIVAVGYVVYGGIRYILSEGEPDKTKQAKNTIVNAMIGVVVAVVATSIVVLVGNVLVG